MKKLILLIIPILINCCTYHNIDINQETDNNEGKAFLNKFYHKISDRDFEGVDAMVADTLKHLAGSHGISKMVKFINTKAGAYKHYEIVNNYIRSITGSTSETSYDYKLKVTYEKGSIDETIGLKKENGSVIKLNSYYANSDLLVQ
jgi:hypothetical protein